MSMNRNDRDTDARPGPGRSAAELQRTGAASPEDDPRRHDGQDVRMAGADDGRPKDDPSRAPESGTP